MDRKKLLRNLETWALVTVLAVLVWLYAEGEAVVEQREQVMIEFVAPSGRAMVIEPDADPDQPDRQPQNPVQVAIWLRGSRGQMEKVKALLEEEGPIEIPVAPGEAQNPENAGRETTVVVRDQLLQSRLGEFGVNIEDAHPGTIDVWVEPLVQLELPVEVEGAPPTLAQPVTTDPAEATVLAPAHLADGARDEQLTVPLGDVDFSQYEVDEEHTVRVPLRKPPELRDNRWVSVRPEMAEVGFTVTRQTEPLTVSLVPVVLKITPQMLNQWSIRVPEEHWVLRDVKIVGPRDVIEKIRNDEIRPRAQLPLSSDDLDTGTQHITPVLDLPSEVNLRTSLPSIPVEIASRSE
ncbi:MAG: hypothetical protein ACLFV3_05640 [Phycisphaeraceae bacterium]